MRWTIKLLVVSSVILFLTTLGSANDYAPRYAEEAELLNSLSLFFGTDVGYELDREPSRLEALVMLIRLSGQQAQARATTASHPFTDVPEWGSSYVAFAYDAGLTHGISATLFGSADLTSEAQFLTFMLRALGYSDQQGDFVWYEALGKAVEIGLVDDTYLSDKSAVFTRDDCVGIAYQALFTKLKGDESPTLLEELVRRDVITQDQALTVSAVDLEAETYSPIVFDLDLLQYVGRSAYEVYEELKSLYGNDVKMTIYGDKEDHCYISILNNRNQEIAFQSYNSKALIIKHAWIGSNASGGVTPYGVDVSSRLERFGKFRVSSGVEGLMSSIGITREDFKTESIVTPMSGSPFRVLSYEWETPTGFFRLTVIDDFSAIFGLGFYSYPLRN